MKPVFRSNLFAMILIITWILGSLLFSLINGLLMIINIPIPYSIQVILPQILFLFIPSLLYILITDTKLKDTFRFYPLPIKSILFIIGFALLIQPLMMFISGIGNLFFSNPVDTMLENLKQMPLSIMILMIGITPALFEELAFRGVILSGYKNIPILKAALMNGLFFGILHMNFQQFIYAFIMGILFTYLVEITGSIFSSMIAHFTINSSQVLLSQFTLWTMKTHELDQLADLTNPTLQNKLISIVSILPLVIIATPLAFLLLYYLSKNHNKSWYSLFPFKKANNATDSNTVQSINGENIITKKLSHEKIMTWPVYISIGIFVVVSIYIEVIFLLKF